MSVATILVVLACIVIVLAFFSIPLSILGGAEFSLKYLPNIVIFGRVRLVNITIFRLHKHIEIKLPQVKLSVKEVTKGIDREINSGFFSFITIERMDVGGRFGLESSAILTGTVVGTQQAIIDVLSAIGFKLNMIADTKVTISVLPQFGNDTIDLKAMAHLSISMLEIILGLFMELCHIIGKKMKTLKISQKKSSNIARS